MMTNLEALAELRCESWKTLAVVQELGCKALIGIVESIYGEAGELMLNEIANNRID